MSLGVFVTCAQRAGRSAVCSALDAHPGLVEDGVRASAKAWPLAWAALVKAWPQPLPFPGRPLHTWALHALNSSGLYLSVLAPTSDLTI